MARARRQEAYVIPAIDIVPVITDAQIADNVDLPEGCRGLHNAGPATTVQVRMTQNGNVRTLKFQAGETRTGFFDRVIAAGTANNARDIDAIV